MASLFLRNTFFVVLVSMVTCRPMPCELQDTGSPDDLTQYALCLEQFYADPSDVIKPRSLSNPKITRKTLNPRRHSTVSQNEEDFLERLDNDEIHTFTGCEGLTEDECREILALLDNLINDVDLFEAATKQSKRHREARSLLTQDLKWRGYKRNGNSDSSKSILERYTAWREQNGYGNARGRWGRDLSHVEQLDSIDDENAIIDDVLSRVRRSRKLSTLELFTLMEEYRKWRQTHGYGQHMGRYGR